MKKLLLTGLLASCFSTYCMIGGGFEELINNIMKNKSCVFCNKVDEVMPWTDNKAVHRDCATVIFKMTTRIINTLYDDAEKNKSQKYCNIFIQGVLQNVQRTNKDKVLLEYRSDQLVLLCRVYGVAALNQHFYNKLQKIKEKKASGKYTREKTREKKDSTNFCLDTLAEIRKETLERIFSERPTENAMNQSIEQ